MAAAATKIVIRQVVQPALLEVLNIRDEKRRRNDSNIIIKSATSTSATAAVAVAAESTASTCCGSEKLLNRAKGGDQRPTEATSDIAVQYSTKVSYRCALLADCFSSALFVVVGRFRNYQYFCCYCYCWRN